MPNRVIKESICTSESVDRMTWFEECFWQRLIVNCDDYGRFDGRTAVLKARLFPLKNDVTPKMIGDALQKLSQIGCVVLYEVGGKPYLYLPSWESHQSIRAKKSKYPSPEEAMQESASICNQVQADESKCYRNPIQSNTNTGMQPHTDGADKPRKFTRPTVEEIKAYCLERRNNVDAQKFFDFYQSKGWMVGKTPMKDWQASVRTWEQKDKRPQGTTVAVDGTVTKPKPRKMILNDQGQFIGWENEA